ncbi:MAG: menaquinone biosynthetic enzyme MqnA/MqnD family protein [Pedobacter sp.]
MSLKVGHIAYANCVPFFHYLDQVGFRGQIQAGVPSHLNAMLALGKIDLSPSSTFEYGRNWSNYGLLPELSISSRGPVQSVLLFASKPLENLAAVPVALTGESATSINLLRILCLEFYGFPLSEMPCDNRSVEEIIAMGGSGLLIGDRALKAAIHTTSPHVYDLGELWWHHTGLPFVFAMWMIHRDAIQHKSSELTAFYLQLKQSLERALSDLDKLASERQEATWMGKERLAAYWRSISYRFTDQHRQGLERFFELAVKHHLLKEKPQLNFFQPCLLS